MLALIIIDQCSRVFFDRTKPLDERPEMMDLFSSAIGHLVCLLHLSWGEFRGDLTALFSLPDRTYLRRLRELLEKHRAALLGHAPPSPGTTSTISTWI